MEKAVEKCERAFKETEANLKAIEEKLHDGVEKIAKTSPSNVNPADLLDKVATIKQEYASVVEETKAIKEAQMEAMQVFHGNLLRLAQTVNKLQISCNIAPEECREIEQIAAVLGVSPSQHIQKEPKSSDKPKSSEKGASGGQRKPFSSPKPLPTPKLVKFQTAQALQEVFDESPSPHGVRAKSHDFMPLTVKEFNSVSETVRGRAKIQEVNQVYQRLWIHFKEEGKKSPLTSSAMFDLGLRVAGRTGEAKLKVLQSLGLLTMSRKGEVQLT